MLLVGIPSLGVVGGAEVAGPTSSLLTGLQVYYALEDLTEEVGGLTLTNNNTATFGAGKIGDAVTVVAASSQYLSRADNAAFQMGTGDFTIACWIKTTDVDDFKAIAIYGERGNAGYGFTWVSSTVRFFVGEGFPYDQATKDATTTLNDGSWHLVVGTCDRTAQEIIIYWDGSSHPSAAQSCSAVGSVNNSVGFKIGAHAGTAADFWDGSVDELGIWNRVLTTSEIDDLWDWGMGITYPFDLFSPTDITGLQLWLKADALSLSDTDPVSSWTDSSGNGNHATQSGSARPLYRTGIVNGRPVVRFDGSDDYLIAPNGAISALGSNITVFVVQKTSVVQNSLILGAVPDDGTNRIFLAIPWSDNTLYFDFGNSGTTGRIFFGWGGNTSDFFLWTCVAGGSSMEVYRNAGSSVASLGSSSSFTPGSKVLHIGGSATVGVFENADVAEILIYNAVLSSTDRDNVRTYLIDKYG